MQVVVGEIESTVLAMFVEQFRGLFPREAGLLNAADVKRYRMHKQTDGGGGAGEVRRHQSPAAPLR